MRAVIRTGPAHRPAGATRRDLLLEALALRHQLAVLARPNRRFRLADRLFWLLLPWLWPRWREALVLIQPGTVARWYREGIRGCWRHRARHPGRPRIDAPCRDLIRRMAAENCLWGAPRIHGELLKLGIAVSERTVSRYLRGRPPRRSQTWRTFFANHLGDPTLTSPLMSADARGDDIVIDASDVSFRPTQLSIKESCVSAYQTVDFALPLQPTFLGMHLRQDHLQDRGGVCTRRGRDPPPHRWLQLRGVRHGFHSCVPAVPLRPTGHGRLFSRTSSPSAVLRFLHKESNSQRLRTAIWNIGEAQPRRDADLGWAASRRPSRAEGGVNSATWLQAFADHRFEAKLRC
jgi:hypothetical protein